MRKIKGWTAVFCCVLLTVILAGCHANEESKSGKTVVTMVYSGKMEHVEALIEEKLPDIDFQWERVVDRSLNSDLLRRLQSGHGPDLVVSTQPADQESGQYVLPLGGYAFSSRYESTLISSLSMDDMVYYLPFPGQYYGYIINQTLLEEAGFSLPKTNEELLEILCWFRDQGIGVNETGAVFGMREKDDVTLGNYMVGCMVPDFLSTANGVQWLADFEEKTVTMADTWEPAFHMLDALSRESLIDLSPYTKQGNTPNNALHMSLGNMVAIYGNSAYMEECRRLNQQAVAEGTGRAYEYAMLPFLSEEDTPNWTIVMPAAYLGINATLAKKGSEETLDACCRILDLLSTREGQDAMMLDTQTDNSYLKEYENQESLPLGLEQVIQDGYVYHVKFPGKVIEYLGREGVVFMNGKQSVSECLAAVDDYYRNGTAETEDDLKIVGSVAQDLIYEKYNVRLGETALGCLVADSVALYANAPIAVANGGGIRASLYEGDVRNTDLQAVCPYDNQIVVVKMTGKTLWDVMENSLSELQNSEGIPGGRFLQVSGIAYTFDSTQPEGHRLISVSLADGTPIEENETYTVAINNYMAGKNGYLEGNGDGNTMLNLYSDALPKAENLEVVQENMGTFRDALRYYFEQHQQAPVTAKIEGRIINLSQEQKDGGR